MDEWLHRQLAGFYIFGNVFVFYELTLSSLNNTSNSHEVLRSEIERNV